MRKSIKHLFGLTLGVSLALGLISSASAEGSVSVQVDGKTVQSAAYIDQNDRTMVSPDIADALGLTQKQEGSRVQFTRNGVSTYFTGSDATFSGSEMDTVPALRDGTLYVPLAYLAQAYNMPVSWDAGSKAVSVSTTSTGPISLDGVPAPAFDYSDANQLPMTGYFSKTLTYPDLQGNSAQREADIYISEHASCRPYFYVIALPDKVDPTQFLMENGWFDLAEENGECLFVLAPGSSGWGSVEEELPFLTAALSWLNTPVADEADPNAPCLLYTSPSPRDLC